MVAYSGGIDSSILATLVTKTETGVTLLTLGRSGSPDVMSILTSRSTFLTKPIVSVAEKVDVENAVSEVEALVSVSSLSHFEDCVAFFLISKAVRNLTNARYVLSANGPDELFCGYDRFRRIVDLEGYDAAQNEIFVALKIAEDLASQVKKVASHFGLLVFEPFLTEEFRTNALAVPIEYKILVGNDLLRKRIWRYYGRTLGLPSATVLKPKKAMQYGMGIHNVTESMLKRGILKLEMTSKKI